MNIVGRPSFTKLNASTMQARRPRVPNRGRLTSSAATSGGGPEGIRTPDLLNAMMWDDGPWRLVRFAPGPTTTFANCATSIGGLGVHRVGRQFGRHGSAAMRASQLLAALIGAEELRANAPHDKRKSLPNRIAFVDVLHESSLGRLAHRRSP